MFETSVIYKTIYAEEEHDGYKVYLLEYFDPANPIVAYHLSKTALEKVIEEFSTKEKITVKARQYLYVDMIIVYSSLIMNGSEHVAALKNALAREIAETVLTANWDGTNILAEPNKITEKDIEILRNIYTEPKRIG